MGGACSLPYVPNARRVTGKPATRSFAGSTAWYRHTLRIEKEGMYAIRFESVNHLARVWMDGVKLGIHRGEFLPFEFRVPLSPGEHTLVVQADWRDPMRMKREAWHRAWFNFGGLNREVSIRPSGPSELSAPTLRTRLRSDGSAQVDVSVRARNHGPERSLKVRGELIDGEGEKFPFELGETFLPSGARESFTGRVIVPRPRLWSPGSPALYKLHLTVPGEAAYSQLTGLRELRHQGRRLYMNGKAIQLRGASFHEDVQGRGGGLTARNMDRIVSDLKNLGASATRSQHPVAPALMERLDAAGIMLWMGVGPVDAPGNFTSRTPRLLAQSKARVRASLAQLQAHPSLIVWNLANEVRGQGGKLGQVEYIDSVARELKEKDPGRLVGLDVWGKHPPKTRAGRMYRNIDVIGDTNYIGWYHLTKYPRKQVNRAIRAHVMHMLKVFPGKAIVVTEFGAEANRQNHTRQPGGFRFQTDLLLRHIRIYSSIPGLSGMLVWNLRDFGVSPEFGGGSIHRQVPNIKLVPGLNQKGLLFYDGREKPSFAQVRKVLAQSGRKFERRYNNAP